jgi:hypothetical protein
MDEAAVVLQDHRDRDAGFKRFRIIVVDAQLFVEAPSAGGVIAEPDRPSRSTSGTPAPTWSLRAGRNGAVASPDYEPLLRQVIARLPRPLARIRVARRLVERRVLGRTRSARRQGRNLLRHNETVSKGAVTLPLRR